MEASVTPPPVGCAVNVRLCPESDARKAEAHARTPKASTSTAVSCLEAVHRRVSFGDSAMVAKSLVFPSGRPTGHPGWCQ